MTQRASDLSPVISVVVAVYNAAEALPDCIESVLSQAGDIVELVIIDGGSTDGTRDLIRAHADALGYWISEPDQGVYDAWNKALDHVRGDWVCFLGADDRFANPAVVTRMAPHLVINRPERVLYGITEVVTKDGEHVAFMGKPWAETKADLPERMSMPNPSTFFRRSLFDDRGRFDVRFRIAGDYEFLLRELTMGDAAFVDELVTVMRAGGLSQEPRTRPLSLREAASARRQNGLPAWSMHGRVELVAAYAGSWLHRWLGPTNGARVLRVYQGGLRRLRRLVP